MKATIKGKKDVVIKQVDGITTDTRPGQVLQEIQSNLFP